MNKTKKTLVGALSVAALALMALGSPAAFANMGAPHTGSTAKASSSNTVGTTWQVAVGPMSRDGMMAMAFFPNVITIDAGDTVQFSGVGHTVTFPGKSGKLPPSTSPQAQMPAGGTSYNGSTFTSSGLMMGKPYALTFTKPGVYPYYCLLHPGMMGVVIVNPTGTAYPSTQAQYIAESARQEQADFAAGETAMHAFKLKSVRNANGTSTYYAQTDAAEPQAYAFNLHTVHSSAVTGSALIAFAQPPSRTNPDITYSIAAKVAGLIPGKSYSAVLSEGKSGSGVTVAHSQFASVFVHSDGNATVTGSVQAAGLPQGVWNLDILNASHQVVATGLIDNPSFAYERFLPAKLVIHPGDQVIWTQTGVNEVHTVTFLPKGWKDIPSESLMPVPYGQHIYSGTGFFNSGFLIPGATYDLTFLQAGNYQYRCLLHDVMGMYGDVDVVPTKGVVTLALGNTILDVPAITRQGVTYVPLSAIEQLLTAGGITSQWNGREWKMTTKHNVMMSSSLHTQGSVDVMINGKQQQAISGLLARRPGTTQHITYVSLQQVRTLMTAFGLAGQWNGSTWDATPSAHAGSIPQGYGKAGTAGMTGSSGMGTGMPGM